ncbi:MAG: DUF1800 domain-containing protein [Betaproteobacteria bacterium]|nr:DUF1800 domain-containing protein [Betaproteobacteria bacterium]
MRVIGKYRLGLLLITLACASAAGLAQSAGGPAVLRESAVSRSEALQAAMGVADARHLLGRTGFGPTPAEVSEFASLSRGQAVARLLEGARSDALMPAPAWVNEPITPPRSLRDATVEQRLAFQQLEMRRGFELRAWWIGEMLATSSPLTERMTLFWHNHFTSSQQKVRYMQLMYRQNALLRQHALGNFGELLHAVSKDPAMVIYLDNASSRRDRPNENFAREVMELFTLGEGHYAETDVREAARAFTGWTIDPETAGFRWRPFLHDPGEKTVLGRRGRFDGDAVLDILLGEPRTAQHIVTRLWREFVSPDPDPTEVSRVARAFHHSRHDIRVALRELLLLPAFWAAENRAALVKSPVDFVVGTLRQFDVRVADATPLALVTASLGQNLFSPPNVKGWPGGEAWINSATLLGRKQFVERLFRADEMRRVALQPGMERGADEAMAARADGGRLEASPQLAAQQQAAQFRARLLRAAGETRFDGSSWFRQFDEAKVVTADCDPHAGLDRFVLADAPAYPVPENVGGRERLRLLTQDPAYQLK